MSNTQFSWEGIEQPVDEATAGSPWFYVTIYKIFQDGLKALLEELKKYADTIEGLELESSPYQSEIDRINQMIDYAEERLNTNVRSATITIHGVSYGSLRYLKAGVLVLVRRLIEKKLKVIQEKKYIPKRVIQAFDEKIQQLYNIAETGLLNGLKPAEVFLEVSVNSTEETNTRLLEAMPYNIPIPQPSEIPIIDSELRERCLGLLRHLEDQGAKEQLDTVVREMSVILEDRIRNLSGVESNLTGVALMSAAFASPPVRLKFSDEKDVQESAHLLFRGYSGFVRNEVMHKPVPSYTRERVLQLLGFVDYLLFILSSAEKATDDNAG